MQHHIHLSLYLITIAIQTFVEKYIIPKTMHDVDWQSGNHNNAADGKHPFPGMRAVSQY